jgi:hypothetical protein
MENAETEGFSFGSMGRYSDHKFRFTPNANDGTSDTHIFDDNGAFKVNKITLPKSGVVSYNLYKIVNMAISKALKHPEKNNIEYDEPSMTAFMKRTAQYIKHVIGERPVDIITYQQSSSDFNAKMVSYLLRLYPNSEGIKFIPNLLTKNVRNVYVNTDVAKKVGLTDDEIHNLQRKVERWKGDEDIRDVRRKLKALEDEVANVVKNRGRGRPSKEFTDKVNLINTYKDQIPLLRKGKRGMDGTIDKNGNIKDFQIKSVDDKERRSLEGLFTINPALTGIQQKLKDKNIVIFDDNISSGATLDDICTVLQKLGVKSILPITLGVIPKTIYGAHEKI